MTDNYDQLALSWVRKEINNTLDQARQGLENFAEDTQDQTQIQFCINCLHQVQGTLQMLEFEGAATLAQEMERLADKMAAEEQFAVESSFEVLMRALLQMPGYLERVEEGEKDIPVVLLPLINELRVASGNEPMAEREVFSATTYNVVPPKAAERVSEVDKTSAFQENAKKLRTHFQKGLTGLIRGQNPKECLSRIHKVLLRLEALTEGHAVARLWWVADGFIFSITEGGLYKKKEIHHLLSMVDKKIKRLADEGTSAQDENVPQQLLSQLLYYVARSHSKNARIVKLKEEFDLEASLSDSEQVKQHQKRLSRPDSTAVTNVVGAINEELISVKDQLDLFVRAQAKDPGQLQNLVESLIRISDTLTLLELAIPRDVIRQQITSIQRLLDANKMPDDAIVMDIAGALLFVEANLKNVNLEAASQSTDEESSSTLSESQAKESEVDEATRALIKVARRSMQSAKDKMINYIASGFDRKALAEVPAIMDEVLGGVRIVKFEEAAEILEVARQFVQERIILVESQPAEEYLDALADVITSVEYYLEASEEGAHKGVISILKGAHNSLNSLKAALAEAPPIIEVEPTDVADESPVFEIVEEAQSQEPSVADAVSEELSEPVVEPPSAQVIPLMASSASKEVDTSLIDDEVLEIFLEEAEEEIASISETLPRWLDNVQDDDALTTLRRSFHTLKGSGRLVGASIIGDLSWSIENMLNRVIEEAIPAETPVTSVLQEAKAMLPSLVESFAEGKPCSDNYQELAAKAEHIAAGKALADFEYISSVADIETKVDTKAETLEASAEADIAEEAIDPVLLEIFTTEAETHLQSISQYLQNAPSEGTMAATDEFIRALHTLKGSANMAGVDYISNLTGPWEKYARLVKGSNQRLEQPTIGLLRDTHEFLSDTLARLKNSETLDGQRFEELSGRIEGLQSSGSGDHASSVKLRDQQFVSIFLTEGLDILQEVSKLNESLADDVSNQQLKQSIFEEIKLFHQGSKILSIDGLEELASATESLSEFAVNRELGDNHFSNLMNQALDGLTDMLNKIASEEDIDTPRQLLATIQEWMEKTGQETAPEDMDVELVELFVEEAEELVETARELHIRWKDNLNSKEINGELRRIYHTLKGSSRMAGAMSIGDLGYAAEDMFNTVVDFGRQHSDRDYDIICTTTDKLESMIAQLKLLSWPGAADAEIKVIRDHLSPDTVEDVAEVVEAEADKEVESVSIVSAPEVLEESEIEAELAGEEALSSIDEAGTLELEGAQSEAINEFGESIPTVSEAIAEDEMALELSEETLESAEDSTVSEPLIEEAEIAAEPESDDTSIDFGEEYLVSEPSEPEQIGHSETVIDFGELAEPEELVESEEFVEPEEIAESEENLVAEFESESTKQELPILTEQEIFEADSESLIPMESKQDDDVEIVVDTISDTLAVEEKVLEELAAEKKAAEEKALEELAAEEKALEELAAEEKVLEELAAEKKAAEEKALEKLAAEEKALEELAAEEKALEELAAEEKALEELAAEEKALEELAAEEKALEELAAEEKALEELAAEEKALEDIESQQAEFIDAHLDRSVSLTETHTEDTIAPAEPIVEQGNVHQVDLDEDGEEVLEIYLEEAEELLETLDEALHDWSNALDNKATIDLLQRTLHTFKGGARLSDLLILGDIAHEMETYFERVNNGQLTASPDDVGFMLQGYDVIEKLVNEVKDHRQMTKPEVYMLSLEALIKGESPTKAAEDYAEAQAKIEQESAPEIVEAEEEQTVAQVVSFEKKKQQQEETKQKPAQSTEVIRVPSDQLESLVNLAGETSIFRSRLEQQMSVFRYNLEEMNSTVERLRDQLRNLDIETDAQISYRREVSGGSEYEDFDPLEMDRYTRQQELTRGLSESSVDLVSLKETLDILTADSETLLLQQGRVNTEMQESLMRTRMIPFESLVPRLRRMVRQISTELGKTIELSISADGEMDRSVLERMVAPLEHMLRNAMDHGIESPQERRAKNKPESGSVKISMFREGGEVYIKIQDDGRGLDLQAIRRKALEKGLITESSELSDKELQQLILEAGFSTAEQVTQISGRGVGMDVVSSEIKQLGGLIEIDSQFGTGTIFTVKLPFTMSVNQALMVQLGDEVYAIPLSNIEGIVRVSPFELEEYYSNPETPFGYAGIDYSMYYLGQLLDHNRAANLQGVTQPLPVLLLHGADHPTALQVDDLLGSREIVVKTIGSQLSSVSGLSGATILGDGRVVLILDMPALIRRIDASLISSEEQEADVGEDRVPVVMVVDDSITVRKVTTRLLERHDFEVITAKDGVDALSILGEQKPDVMLLDIEMPRMDGFELATIIRHDEGLKDLPIIMITSRTGEKHRERAEQIGVNQYMGKPYNEVDLLESISALLPNKS